MADHSALIGPPPAPAGADHSALIGPPPMAQPAQNGPSGYAADSGSSPSPSTLMSMVKGIGDSTANAAPTAGMMVGGSIGGTAGAAAGGVGVVPGAIAGAGVGGAAGSAYKRVYQYLTGARDPNQDTALGNAGDIAKAGLGGMAAETVGQGTGALLKAVIPKVVGAGASLAANVPVSSGEAAAADPGILNRAQPMSVMGKAYDAFERYTGLKGVGGQIDSGGLKAADLGNNARFDYVNEVASRVKAGAPIVDASGAVVKEGVGAPVSTQELYTASQHASNLNFGPFENPAAQKLVQAGSIARNKGVVDTALESVYPEYQGLRQGMWESGVRNDFAQPLPVNANGTLNKLRPWLAASEAGSAVMAGHPGAIAALPLMSPAVLGGGIRAGAALSPAAKFLAKYGAAKTAQDAAEGQ